MCLAPSVVVPHFLIGITIAVAFLVGLVHDVHAPSVAKLVEVFAVGIMRGAQEVDVGLFHQPDVLLVGGIIDVASSQRMVVVAVDAAQFHVLSVDFEHLAHALHALHAKVVVEMFYDLFLASLLWRGFQFQAECIEVGLFRRP